jgi:hypothetical protein
LHEKEGLSNAIKTQVEKSLIEGIQVCRKNQWMGDFLSLLEREGLSNAVREEINKTSIEIIKLCADSSNMGLLEIRGILPLLTHEGLSDTVRRAAQEELAKLEQRDPVQIVAKYLKQKNPLAGDGLMVPGNGGMKPKPVVSGVRCRPLK